jgi:hypothetical protein
MQSKAGTAAEFEANKLAFEREQALVDQRSQAGAYPSGGSTATSRAASAARGTTAGTD